MLCYEEESSNAEKKEILEIYVTKSNAKMVGPEPLATILSVK